MSGLISQKNIPKLKTKLWFYSTTFIRKVSWNKTTTRRYYQLKENWFFILKFITFKDCNFKEFHFNLIFSITSASRYEYLEISFSKHPKTEEKIIELHATKDGFNKYLGDFYSSSLENNCSVEIFSFETLLKQTSNRKIHQIIRN